MLLDKTLSYHSQCLSPPRGMYGDRQTGKPNKNCSGEGVGEVKLL